MTMFSVSNSCHDMYCIQSYILSTAECRLIRAIVSNNRMDSLDYQLGRKCGAFLQGYQEPRNATSCDGWVLVEFWIDSMTDIQNFIDHLNHQKAKQS